MWVYEEEYVEICGKVCGDMEKYGGICGKVCGYMRKSMSRYAEKYVGI